MDKVHVRRGKFAYKGKQIAEDGWIKSTSGAESTPQGVVDLLNRIGFTYKKTTEVPYEADTSKQEAVAVVGKQIYWAPYEDYQNNKTLKYNWKWYFGKSFI